MAQIEIDNDKIDFMVRPQKSGPNQQGLRAPVIDVQLKATSSPNYSNSHFNFDLDVDSYNSLVGEDRHLPPFLFVVVVPTSQHDWIVASENELALRHQGFWFPMSGLQVSTNAKTERVKIPLSNRLSPRAVAVILDGVQR